MAQLFLTDDGSHSIFSEKFGVSYHSKFGAVQETQHVFIDAALKFFVEKTGKTDLKILEIGFGTGLNAFMTLIEAVKNNWNIHYTTYEAYPLSMEQVQTLNYPFEIENGKFKDVFDTLHQKTWNEAHILNENFTVQKVPEDFQSIDFHNSMDIIYFDAFAPQAQPELWEIPMLQKMFDALKPEGLLTTYCAKGSVKRNFRALGFDLEAIPGPPGKREMTRVVKKEPVNVLVM